MDDKVTTTTAIDPTSLTPQQIVAELDRYIVGQEEAKRAVAVALRNRDRRRSLPEEIRKEIMPKNILMIGSTGIGKTEIARRVASLIHAPFVKVDATVFTEVGYVGRDVDSIVRDLVEAAVDLVQKERLEEVRARAEQSANERILDYLCQQYPVEHITRTTFDPRRRKPLRRSPVESGATGTGAMAATATIIASPADQEQPQSEPQSAPAPVTPALNLAEKRQLQRRRRVARLLNSKILEDTLIEIDLPDDEGLESSYLEFPPGIGPDEMVDTFNDFLSRVRTSSQRRYRQVSVKEARRLLAQEEADRLIDWDQVMATAIQRAEESGVVFIDEIDKLVGPAVEVGADVSGEGVQRDLLPIVEGTTVSTRYGPIHTDHVLFIAAGSFQRVRPSDLIPELQGRFPLRVELRSLTEADFVRILTEPANSLIRQYQALLQTEGVQLEFTPDGLQEIAHLAAVMNERLENIGARRLHTIVEKVLEDLSFRAHEFAGQTVTIDREYVASRLLSLVRDEDLSRYIL